MNAEQVNREIAEKVMGWIVHTTPIGEYYATSDGTMWADDFDPMHRIEHAMMALEKFPLWKISKHPDGSYEVIIGVGKGYRGGAADKKLEEAICLAALAAKDHT